MKTLKELKEARQSAVNEMQALISITEKEDRNMTEQEVTDFDGFTSKVEGLDSRIDRLERSLELVKSAPVSLEIKDTSKDKDLRDFSFQDAVKAAYTGVLEGRVKEMDQEARLEMGGSLLRGVAIPSSVLHSRAAATANPGTDLGSYVDQLQANSVLVDAGANFYSGLAADRKFPVINSIASSWVAEAGSQVASAGAVGSVSLDPKKLLSVIEMTAELMNQNTGVEAALRKNMAASQMATWEAALLKNAATTTNGPDSIFNDATAVSTTVTLDNIFKCETDAIAAGNNPASGRMAYLLNSDALKTVKGLAGENFVSAFMDPIQKQLNTYKYLTSANVGNGDTGGQVLFADFNKVHMGVFGAMSILFDPYTKADYGLGRLVATSLVDGVLAQSGAAYKIH